MEMTEWSKEIDPDVIEMMELADKNIKNSIIDTSRCSQIGKYEPDDKWNKRHEKEPYGTPRDEKYNMVKNSMHRINRLDTA